MDADDPSQSWVDANARRFRILKTSLWAIFDGVKLLAVNLIDALNV